MSVSFSNLTKCFAVGWVVFFFFFLLQKSSMMDQSIFIVLPDTLWSFLLKCIILCSNIFLWTTLISVGSLEGLSVYYCHFCLQRATSPWKEKNITNSKHCGLFLVLKYVYHDDFCCPRTEPKTKVLKSWQLFCLILLFCFSSMDVMFSNSGRGLLYIIICVLYE